jgi:hypothetical protein
MDGARRGTPLDDVARGAELSDESLRENRREASAPWLQRAVRQYATEVQTIARARQRHVKEALALLRFLRRSVLVRAGSEIADGNGHVGLPFARHNANRIAEPSGAARKVHHKDHWKLQSLRGMYGHQTCGISRVDYGIGFIADGEPIQVGGDTAERGVAAVLNPADQRANLLEVFARLQQSWPSHLDEIRRISKHEVEQFCRRKTIDQIAPPSARVA